MTESTEKETNKSVYLVDGNSYLYRAFYATPHLSNSKGTPTNAIYAFVSMIKKLRSSESPDTLIIVFDSRGPSFREEISKEYKAQRPPMPDNLSLQIPYVKRIIDAMGLPVIEKEGFEADDIIATITEHFKTHDDVTISIVTSDKDMMQLVGNRVRILDSMKNLLIGEAEVIEKFGVSPVNIVDYLSLCGDSSDNIPGVPGIGGKTARELVSTMGSVEDIYGNLDAVSRKSVKEKLIAGKDKAELSKKLATLRYDVPIDTGVENLSQRAENPEALRGIYRELEFTALYREIRIEGAARKEVREKTLAELNMGRVAVAASFQGKNAGNLCLEAFAASDGEGVFLSAGMDDLSAVLSAAREVIVHNAKPFFIIAGESLRGKKIFDTMLAAYLVNPMRKDYSLATILEEYSDSGITADGMVPSLRDTAPYICGLADTLLLKMEPLALTGLFFRTEMPLVEVLADMELAGVRVDRKKLGELSREFDGRLTGIVKEIYSHSGEPFNINSPQQLSRVLFDTLGLIPVKKTKTGFSTDTEVLETLSVNHPLPGKVLEYRTLTKLKNTYIDVLPELINPHTGRIHTTFNQMVVATGRLSSSDPNLQNIPIRGEEGPKIRQSFVPGEGCTLLSSDYSQIELRVLAHLSKDPELIKTFHGNEDIHSTVAQGVFGVGIDGVTQDMRRVAKVINFGIIYGMSAFGLAKELGVTQREAQHYIDGYFERHSAVRAFMNDIIDQARRQGYVKTLFGRTRFIPEINNNDQAVRQLGERAAMNTPIQGTAADIIKLAMINIHHALRQRGLSSKLILQIHDELLFEVVRDETDIMEKLVRDEMENVISLDVPLTVSIGTGHSWAEAHS
ncbi:MAG TPA: DNA polymerase I [Syntrophorhabdaceae bacterium]|nr:DNA polymerase I [Syntrophorhabdaceae bacterium]